MWGIDLRESIWLSIFILIEFFSFKLFYLVCYPKNKSGDPGLKNCRWFCLCDVSIVRSRLVCIGLLVWRGNFKGVGTRILIGGLLRVEDVWARRKVF